MAKMIILVTVMMFFTQCLAYNYIGNPTLQGFPANGQQKRCVFEQSLNTDGTIDVQSHLYMDPHDWIDAIQYGKPWNGNTDTVLGLQHATWTKLLRNENGAVVKKVQMNLEFIVTKSKWPRYPNIMQWHGAYVTGLVSLKTIHLGTGADFSIAIV